MDIFDTLIHSIEIKMDVLKQRVYYPRTQNEVLQNLDLLC
jgi:hypothetical protein